MRAHARLLYSTFLHLLGLRSWIWSSCCLFRFIQGVHGLLPVSSPHRAELLASPFVSVFASSFDLRLWGQMQAAELAADFSFRLKRQALNLTAEKRAFLGRRVRQLVS